MTSQPPAPIRRRKLAIRLTRLRKAAGKTQLETSDWTGLSQSTISKIENAAQEIEVKHVRLLAQFYDVGAPEVDQLVRMAEQSNDRGLLVEHLETAPDFARDYFELEGYAHEIHVHEPGWVFGLFQIPEYIRAVRLAFKPDASEEELQRSVALRTARQERLSGDNPPVLDIVLSEAALHLEVGSPAVMAAQLRYLQNVSLLPNVTLRVLPFSAGMYWSGFTILRFDDTPGMDVVYVENQRAATYHEKPSDLAYFVDKFETIKKSALSEEASREHLDNLRSQLWEQPKGVEEHD